MSSCFNSSVNRTVTQFFQVPIIHSASFRLIILFRNNRSVFGYSKTSFDDNNIVGWIHSYRPIYDGFWAFLVLSVAIFTLSCQANATQELSADSLQIAEDISTLKWAELESSFESIFSSAHIRTTSTSWLKPQGELIAHHTATYQVDPNDGAHLLLSADSLSRDPEFDWPSRKQDLAWLNKNPYKELRLDSTLYSSPKVMERYSFQQDNSNWQINSIENAKVVFDDILIVSVEDDIESVQYKRSQDGFLFEESTSVDIKQSSGNDPTPLSWTVESVVKPIFSDGYRIKTEVAYKHLSSPL